MSCILFVIICFIIVALISDSNTQKEQNEAFRIARENSLKKLKTNYESIGEKFFNECRWKKIDFLANFNDVSVKVAVEQILRKEGIYLHMYDDYATIKGLFIKGRDRYIYNYCFRYGIYDLDSEKNKEKAKLFLDNLEIPVGLDISDLSDLLRREQENRDDGKRAKERDEMKKLQKYQEYIGREKPLQFYRPLVAQYKKKSNEASDLHARLIKNKSALISLGTQKTHDWAVHGGIASGIAGGAAGLATANRIQQQNSKIEDFNKSVMSSNLDTWQFETKFFERQMNHYGMLAHKCEKIIEKLSNCLVSELPENDLLNKLNPQIKSQQLIETTGSIVMEVAVSPAELMIFEDVPAVIDGSFKAILRDKNKDNKKVGEMFFVLPLTGSQEAGKIKGICQYVNTDPSELNIQFEPYHLWAIEKVNHPKLED